MLSLPLALLVAIVTQNATPLRAAARDTAARQMNLAQGDWLEVRGERLGFLQVYDHRHERPGYVRPYQVRTYPVDERSARDLGAVIDFLHDQPGSEALGIGYVALFLRVAPPSTVDGTVFDALGTFAERLARRASSRWAKPGDAALAAEIEVAESYGVHFKSFAQEGRTRVCYDGEAFRRVLALPSPPVAKVRAALGLTEAACVDPALPAADRASLAAWRADLLSQVDPSRFGSEVPLWLANRLRLRRAAAQAEMAYFHARKGEWKAAAAAGDAAVKELALVDKQELADEDGLSYAEAAVQVGAIRWASEPAAATEQRGLELSLATGQPGQTCVRVSQKKTRLYEDCTYGVVWPASLRVSPRRDAVTFAVSTLPGWSELVLMRRGKSGWSAQPLAPAAIDPELGYVELAGWSPDGAHLLVAREARVTGPFGQPGTEPPRVSRSFQILRAGEL
ncbi:MAG TPA: hypothetical protein VII38_15945, partial [Polyangia bacterium]